MTEFRCVTTQTDGLPGLRRSPDNADVMPTAESKQESGWWKRKTAEHGRLDEAPLRVNTATR